MKTQARIASIKSLTKTPIARALETLWQSLPIKSELVDELAASIKAVGQRIPIQRIDGVVVDGRHRELACAKAGVKPAYADVGLKAVAKSIAKDCDPVTEVFIAQNVVRNHLTIGERALIAASYAQLPKGANQHAANAARFSRKKLAQTFAVSEDTIDRGKTLLKSGRTDLIERVKRGASPGHAVRMLEAERFGAHVKKIAAGNQSAAHTLNTLVKKKLNIGVVLADPPWKMSSGGTATHSGAPEHHYPTMELDAIKALPVCKLVAPDSICVLWIPNFMIPDGLEVLEAWGFSRYITSMVWVKEQPTVSQGAILPMHETVLVGARGQGLPRLEKGVPRIRSWHREAVKKHSQKPSWFAEEIERVYPKAGKLEMFARSVRPGWIAWGNQANGASNDVRTTDRRLITIRNTII